MLLLVPVCLTVLLFADENSTSCFTTRALEEGGFTGLTV